MADPTRFVKLNSMDHIPARHSAGFRRAIELDRRRQRRGFMVDELSVYEFAFWGYATVGQYCFVDAALPDTAIAALPGRRLSDLIDIGLDAKIRSAEEIEVTIGTPVEADGYIHNGFANGSCLFVALDRAVETVSGSTSERFAGMEHTTFGGRRVEAYAVRIIRQGEGSPDPMPHPAR